MAATNSAGRGPKYREIAAALRVQIADGKYPPDARIPSEPQLVGRFRVSRVTARQAIQLLETEGLVRRIRGSGTYVNRLGPEGKPLTDLRHAALLRVDAPPAHGYYLKGIEAAQRWLGSRGGKLSIIYMTGQELLHGALTAQLCAGGVQALMVDGIISDAHAQVIQRAGLPFLVVGNLAISRSVPQIRFAVGSMVRRAIERMSKVRPDLPIVLLVDSTVFQFKREVLTAYRQFIRTTAQKRPIVVEWTGNSFKALTALADSECARFTVLTCERELAALTRFYQSVKTPLVDQVICQINSPEMVTADDRRTRFFIPVSSEAIMPEAVRVLTEMVEGGRRAHYQELDAEIEPPH